MLIRIMKSVSLVLLGSLAFCFAAPAQAALVAISLNFTDAAHLIPAGTPAGTDPAGTFTGNGFTNWNNITAFTGIYGGTLKLSDGTTLSGVTYTQKSWEFAAPPAPTFGTVGDQLLFGGANGRAYILTSTANSQNKRLKISGLNAVFPNGYTVRSYQDYYSNNVGGGTIFVSPNVADYGISESNSSGFATPNTTSGNFSYLNSNGFANNLFVNGHYVSIAAPPNVVPNGGIGSDLIVLTNQQTFGGSSTAFSQGTWVGLQIVGDVISTTPTTYNLAASDVVSPTVIVGGTTGFNSTITNTGTPPGTADTLNYTGLSATASSGLVTGGPGSGGPLANNSVGVGTQALTFDSTGVTPSSVTLTPTRTTATNGTLGGAATLGTTTTASVTVLAHSNGDFGNVSGAAMSTFGVNSLTLDFGSVEQGAGGGFLDSFFAVFNQIATLGFTAAMDLDTNVDTTGIGNVASLFRQSGATIFSNLAASGPAGGQAYTFRFDTAVLGTFSATYHFRLSDQNLPGATAPNSGDDLILTLTGVVAPEPSSFALAVVGLGGLLGVSCRFRRRSKRGQV